MCRISNHASHSDHFHQSETFFWDSHSYKHPIRCWYHRGVEVQYRNRKLATPVTSVRFRSCASRNSTVSYYWTLYHARLWKMRKSGPFSPPLSIHVTAVAHTSKPRPFASLGLAQAWCVRVPLQRHMWHMLAKGWAWSVLDRMSLIHNRQSALKMSQMWHLLWHLCVCLCVCVCVCMCVYECVYLCVFDTCYPRVSPKVQPEIITLQWWKLFFNYVSQRNYIVITSETVMFLSLFPHLVRRSWVLYDYGMETAPSLSVSANKTSCIHK